MVLMSARTVEHKGYKHVDWLLDDRSCSFLGVTKLCANPHQLKRLGLAFERRADSPDCCNC
jgi:hypothetical protein